MTQLTFDQAFAFSLYASNEQFPIDLDDAWQWLGHNQKSDVLAKLKDNFEEDLDFSEKSLKASTGGRPRRFIVLSIDCFKHLAMMAGTDQGKAIRRYFLECERIAKATVANNQQVIPSSEILAITALATKEIAARQRLKEAEDEIKAARRELDTILEEQVIEAKRYYNAHPDIVKQVSRINEILERASNDNPFRSLPSTKK